MSEYEQYFDDTYASSSTSATTVDRDGNGFWAEVEQSLDKSYLIPSDSATPVDEDGDKVSPDDEHLSDDGYSSSLDSATAVEHLYLYPELFLSKQDRRRRLQPQRTGLPQAIRIEQAKRRDEKKRRQKLLLKSKKVQARMKKARRPGHPGYDSNSSALKQQVYPPRFPTLEPGSHIHTVLPPMTTAFLVAPDPLPGYRDMPPAQYMSHLHTLHKDILGRRMHKEFDLATLSGLELAEWERIYCALDMFGTGTVNDVEHTIYPLFLGLISCLGRGAVVPNIHFLRQESEHPKIYLYASARSAFYERLLGMPFRQDLMRLACAVPQIAVEVVMTCMETLVEARKKVTTKDLETGMPKPWMVPHPSRDPARCTLQELAFEVDNWIAYVDLCDRTDEPQTARTNPSWQEKWETIFGLEEVPSDEQGSLKKSRGEYKL